MTEKENWAKRARSKSRHESKCGLDRRYNVEINHWLTTNDQFEDNWPKSYDLIFAQYCSHNMQSSIMELPNFELQILDNQLELLANVKKSMHLPMKTVHPSIDRDAESVDES